MGGANMHVVVFTCNLHVQQQKVHHVINEYQLRLPKSTQTRKDKGKYAKPNSYIFALLWKDVGMDEDLYIYHHFYPSLFVYFWACHSYISFDFKIINHCIELYL